MKRYCFALDLKDDPTLIAEYIKWHQPEHVWPHITKSIQSAGIQYLEIYQVANRLFMIIEADATFSLEAKAAMDAADEDVQRWENLMWKYQQQLPFATGNQKWILMDCIYKL